LHFYVKLENQNYKETASEKYITLHFRV